MYNNIGQIDCKSFHISHRVRSIVRGQMFDETLFLI